MLQPPDALVARIERLVRQSEHIDRLRREAGRLLDEDYAWCTALAMERSRRADALARFQDTLVITTRRLLGAHAAYVDGLQECAVAAAPVIARYSSVPRGVQARVLLVTSESVTAFGLAADLSTVAGDLLKCWIVTDTIETLRAADRAGATAVVIDLDFCSYAGRGIAAALRRRGQLAARIIAIVSPTESAQALLGDDLFDVVVCRPFDVADLGRLLFDEARRPGG